MVSNGIRHMVQVAAVAVAEQTVRMDQVQMAVFTAEVVGLLLDWPVPKSAATVGRESSLSHTRLLLQEHL
jgi:hypothetical protein